MVMEALLALVVVDGASLNGGLPLQLRFPFSQMARSVNGCEAQAALHFLFLFLLVVLSFLLAGLQHSISNCAGNGLINLRQGYGLLFKKKYELHLIAQDRTLYKS
jgi:hypothetical protein